MVDRHVITFSCGAGPMLPLFQFDFDQGFVRRLAAAALSERIAVITDDEVAHWLCLPKSWLNGAIPARTLSIAFPAVLAAARADRTMAKG